MNPEADSFHRYDHDTPARIRPEGGLIKVGLVLVVTIAFMGILLLAYNTLLSGHEPCNFPPCPWIY